MDQSEHTSGIGVYPAFFKIRLNPGESRKLSLTVQNHFSQSVTVSPQAGEFGQNPDSLLNYTVTNHSMDEWISAESIVVPPKGTQDLSFTITVPPENTITEGSYYPSLVLTFDTSSQGDAATIEMEHSIPIYVEVPESAVAEIDVTRFISDTLVIGSDIDITTEIINTGTTYTTPRAFVEMYKLGIVNKDHKVRTDTLPVNQRRATLLPGSILSETVSWGENTLGHYEATLYVMAQDEEQAVRQIDFWIIPSQYIFAATALIFFITAFAVVGLLKRRTHNNEKTRSPKLSVSGLFRRLRPS